MINTSSAWVQNRNQTAIFWKNERISYRQMLIRSSAVAALYSLPPHARVVIFSENRPEWIYALFSVFQNKGVAVPVDLFSPADELAYILQQTEPAVVFCSAKTLPTVREVLNGQDQLSPRVIQFDQPGFPADADGNTEPQEIVPGKPDDLAAILYTSGTTGAPKGVMLTFQNLQANLTAICETTPIFHSATRTFALLPFHHILPLMGSIIAPLYAGGSIAMAHTMDPVEMVATIRRHRVTLMIGVPRLYDLITKAIMDNLQASAVGRLLFKLSAKVDHLTASRILMFPVQRKFGGHLLHLVSGGAALDYPVARNLSILGFEVLEGYGMTECAPLISFPRPGHVRLGSCGQPCLPDSIRIEDGEVLTRGPQVCKGYWKNQEATDEAIQDGWLHTGDLGYLDQNNYLFITGRKKEIIVLPNGKKVNPAEIEEKLLSLGSNIRELAVTMRDGLLHALILPTPGFLRDIPAVQSEHFRWRLLDSYNRLAPPSKKITRLTILTAELPRTRIGKLKRHELPQLAIGTYTKPADDSGTEAKPAGPVYAAYEHFLRDTLECRQIYPSSHWEMDFALDSLARVSLLVFTEKTFGLRLDENIFQTYPTLQSLVQYVEKNKLYQQNAARGTLALFDPDADTPLDLPRSTWVHPFLATTFGFGLRSYFRVRCSGLENLPTNTSCILAPNHQSYIDGLFITTFLPRAVLRRTFFYAKQKHVKDGFLTHLADHANVIIVDVDRGDVKLSLQKLAQAVKGGGNLILFPEGTRSADGQLGDFKPTFAHLAQELNVPIVPVAISGAYHALPRGARFPRPLTRVHIQFLPAVFPRDFSDDHQLSEYVRDQIAQHLA